MIFYTFFIILLISVSIHWFLICLFSIILFYGQELREKKSKCREEDEKKKNERNKRQKRKRDQVEKEEERD